MSRDAPSKEFRDIFQAFTSAKIYSFLELSYFTLADNIF